MSNITSHIKVVQLMALPVNLEPVRNPHKFLYSSLLSEIKFYKDAADCEYISFFGSVYFKLVEQKAAQSGSIKASTELTKPSCVYDIYRMTKDTTNKEISLALRGSKTVVVSDVNCFDSTSVKAVFSESGGVHLSEDKW